MDLRGPTSKAGEGGLGKGDGKGGEGKEEEKGGEPPLL